MRGDDGGGGKFKRMAAVQPVAVEPHIPVSDDADEEAPKDSVRLKKKTKKDVPEHLEWAEAHGVKDEDLQLVDKLVTLERYRPREPGTTERVEHLLARLIKERYLSTRALGYHLYKAGVKSIWIRSNKMPFYGPEDAYVAFMNKRDVVAALDSLENVSSAYTGNPGQRHGGKRIY